MTRERPQKVLIAGGAGYIGSTIASMCIDEGLTPILLDNLVTGRREFTVDRIFYEGDIADGPLIDKIFRDHPDIHVAIHCAALIAVPDSAVNPIDYYRANVVKSLGFASSLIRNGCSRMIFSSSASIYKSDGQIEVDEDAPIEPQSPYARTKAVCESLFEDVAKAEKLSILSLRYFNPIGADPELRTGLQSARPSHALGKMIESFETRVPFEVTGSDYSTRDGTGIRDYVHVWDLAAAHLAAIRRIDDLLTPEKKFEAINLGSGTGTTVRELLEAFVGVTGHPIEAVDAPRRLGDVAGVYASNKKARRLLDWHPRFSVDEGIHDSLRWAAIRKVRLG